MNELSSQYDVDTVNTVEANMARRGTAFLSKYQNQITGGVPTDRNTFDPAVPLSLANGGDKVLVLDSNLLEHGWEEKDRGAQVNRLRKPRTTFQTDSQGSGASSGLDSQV